MAAALIASCARAAVLGETSRVYRGTAACRGNFSGTFDQLILKA